MFSIKDPVKVYINELMETFFANYDTKSKINFGLLGGTISIKNLILKHDKFNEILYFYDLKLKAAQVDDFNLTVSWRNLYEPIKVKISNLRFLVMPLTPNDLKETTKKAAEFRKVVEHLESFFLKYQHHFQTNFANYIPDKTKTQSMWKKLLGRIELEVGLMSMRIEDDLSIIDHPVAIDIKLHNIILKNKDNYFEFVNISTNQVTKKNVVGEDICLTLKITNLSIWVIKDAALVVPQSLYDSIDSSLGIFSMLDMEEFKALWDLRVEEESKVLTLSNILSCIVISGVSTGKLCHMTVDSVYVNLSDSTIKTIRQLLEVGNMRRAGKLAVRWANECVNVNKDYFPQLEFMIKYVQLNQHKSYSSNFPSIFKIAVESEFYDYIKMTLLMMNRIDYNQIPNNYIEYIKAMNTKDNHHKYWRINEKDYNYYNYLYTKIDPWQLLCLKICTHNLIKKKNLELRYKIRMIPKINACRDLALIFNTMDRVYSYDFNIKKLDILNEIHRVKKDHLIKKLWNLRKKPTDEQLLKSLSVPKKNIFDLRVKAINFNLYLEELNKCVFNAMIKDFATKYHTLDVKERFIYYIRKIYVFDKLIKIQSEDHQIDDILKSHLNHSQFRTNPDDNMSLNLDFNLENSHSNGNFNLLNPGNKIMEDQFSMQRVSPHEDHLPLKNMKFQSQLKTPIRNQDTNSALHPSNLLDNSFRTFNSAFYQQNASKILETDLEDSDKYISILHSDESSKGFLLEVFEDYNVDTKTYKTQVNVSIPSMTVHLVESVYKHIDLVLYHYFFYYNEFYNLYFNKKFIEESYANASYIELCVKLKDMIMVYYNGNDLDLNVTVEPWKYKFDIGEEINGGLANEVKSETKKKVLKRASIEIQDFYSEKLKEEKYEKLVKLVNLVTMKTLKNVIKLKKGKHLTELDTNGVQIRHVHTSNEMLFNYIQNIIKYVCRIN